MNGKAFRRRTRGPNTSRSSSPCVAHVFLRDITALTLPNTLRQVLEAAGTDEAKAYIEEIKAA